MASAAALDVVQAFPGPVFLKHVDLDAEATLPYTPDPIGYTDCVEISLLRFFQLAFWSPLPGDAYAAACESATTDPQVPVAAVDMERVVALAGEDSPLVAFFAYHPTIHVVDFYDDTPQGQEVRTRWSVLLTRQPHLGIKYFRMGVFEVDSTVTNIFAVTRWFFPGAGISDADLDIVEDGEVYAERLGRVFRYLSRPGLELEARNVTVSRYEIGDGFMFHRGTNFDVFVNGTGVYNWDWYELRHVDLPVDTTSDSGHSEFTELRRDVLLS